MRALGLLALVAACSEPRLVMKPLPPLAPPVGPILELAPGPLGFIPGEHLIWEVQARGMEIGRIELAVEDHAITSHFRTNRLVSAFATIDHELVTFLDDNTPREANEKLEYDGKVGQSTIELAHTNLHSLHTALGAIRAWAHEGAHPGFIEVAFMDRHFRLELEQPSVEGETLRIDAHIGGEMPIGITMFLDAERRPVRIEIRADDERVSAELISSDGT